MKKNTKSLIKTIKDNRLLIYGLIAIICLLFLFVIYSKSLEHLSWNEIAKEAAWSIFSAVLVLVLVDFSKGEAEENARKEELKEIVASAMTADSFVEKINDSYVDELLKGCISHYAPNMADNYVDYIKNYRDVYRNNFEYIVTLKPNTKDDGKSITIIHSVKYRKHFIKEEERKEYKLKSFFSIKKGGLDAVMGDNSIFFREEILHEPTIAEITDILKSTIQDEDKKCEILKLLEIELFLYKNSTCSNKVKPENISMETTESGILFSHTIDKQYITEEETATGDTYISYEGKVNCEYAAKRENQFYCIFPNPTIGATFEMHFENSIVSNIKEEVNYITMLSLDKNVYELTPSSRHNSITFKTENTIFPRSGILIQWGN